eukprot:gene8101-biopygen12110
MPTVANGIIGDTLSLSVALHLCRSRDAARLRPAARPCASATARRPAAAAAAAPRGLCGGSRAADASGVRAALRAPPLRTGAGRAQAPALVRAAVVRARRAARARRCSAAPRGSAAAPRLRRDGLRGARYRVGARVPALRRRRRGPRPGRAPRAAACHRAPQRRPAAGRRRRRRGDADAARYGRLRAVRCRRRACGRRAARGLGLPAARCGIPSAFTACRCMA